MIGRLLELSGVSSPSKWLVDWVRGGETAAGVAVNADTALNYSAVFRAVSLISGTLATLPIHVYSRVSDQERIRQSGHPIERLFNREPNDETDSVTLRETTEAHALLTGDGFCLITKGSDGRANRLDLLRPNCMTVKRSPVGLVYSYTEGGTTQAFDSSEVFHLRGLGDGLRGWSVVSKARQTIGLGLASEESAAALYANGIRPSGFVRAPHKLDAAQESQLRNTFEKMHRGASNAHRLGILSGGLEFMPAQITPEDAQFLESRKFTIAEIARWFGVPPHLLGDLDRATFSNIEAQGQEFLNYCLRYWIVKWERAIERVFLTEEEKAAGFYVEFKTEAIVKADLASRYSAYNVGRNGGWLSANDVLRAENMNAIGPQGDIYLVPANMQNAGQLKAALHEAFSQTMRRLVRKEVAGLKATKDLTAFYQHHAGLLHKELGSLLEAFAVLGEPRSGFVERYCDESKALLAANADTADWEDTRLCLRTPFVRGSGVADSVG